MYSIIALVATVLLACALWCLTCHAFHFRLVMYAMGSVMLSVCLVLALG
jgi:hypothetical protein